MLGWTWEALDRGWQPTVSTAGHEEWGTKVRRYNWHSAGSLGWQFPMLKYNYIIRIQYTEAMLSNSTRKLLRFEITKMLMAVLTNKFILSFVIVLGTLSFPMLSRKRLSFPNFQKHVGLNGILGTNRKTLLTKILRGLISITSLAAWLGLSLSTCLSLRLRRDTREQ